jgi:hypothetical protein
MSDQVLTRIRDLIQEDVNQRGLGTDSERNLITVCAGDFGASCRSLAETLNVSVAIVTGFLIPTASPPARGETDGPLGAIFLARALARIGIKVALITDPFCRSALAVGLEACNLDEAVPLLTLPPRLHPWPAFVTRDWPPLASALSLTHLIALERVGPSHTSESIRSQPGTTAKAVAQFEREVPPDHFDCCHTMRGRDITAMMSPAHLLFEAAYDQSPRITTIGIGDGGNEIGMGKIPWEVIRRNIPLGGMVACRVPTDHLIVCGISNWGAYGLAAGVRLLRGEWDSHLFDPNREQELLRVMVAKGLLVDGVTGQATVTVDGLRFERYAEPLRRLAEYGIV